MVLTLTVAATTQDSAQTPRESQNPKRSTFPIRRTLGRPPFPQRDGCNATTQPSNTLVVHLRHLAECNISIPVVKFRRVR